MWKFLLLTTLCYGERLIVVFMYKKMLTLKSKRKFLYGFYVGKSNVYFKI